MGSLARSPFQDPVVRIAAMAGTLLAIVLAVVLAVRLGLGEPRACAVCGEAIGREEAYAEPEYDDVYHASHAQMLRCDYCGRIVSEFSTGGPGVWKLDGRRMCASCHHVAVVDWDEGKKIAAAMRGRLAQLGLKLPNEVQLSLVDEVTLKRLFEKSHVKDGMIEGLTQQTRFSDGREELEVFVLSGLPRARCEWVVAHELTHAWNYALHTPVHAPRLEEGAAELVAMKIMAGRTNPAAKRLVARALENETPIYGDGLRKAAQYEQAHGFNQLVRLLKASKDF
ncbi:MAG: hypothetical protein JWM80_3329 [Cyanobacteria bacterium RYN_339]|nr:hypothetical protein [Cyanobacteria bacterium RYN_339]